MTDIIHKLNRVTIIGVGLLGGSIGLALKSQNRRLHVVGVGRREASLNEARRVGAIDEYHVDAAAAVRDSDLVILATPIGAFETYLRAIKPHLKKGAIVTDVGSTKAMVVRLAEKIMGKGGPFVGSHPMAGSEKKGPAYATANLLAGARCVVTPTAATPRALVRRVDALWRELGMRTVRMSPAAHDKAAARISHLPHAVSCLLMCLAKQGDLAIIGTGFRGMTRLAGSDSEVWRDIFLTNRQPVLDAIAALDEALMRFGDLIETNDADALAAFLADAQKRRQKIQ